MMKERLPAGDVATGLVQAYFINYLQYVLFPRPDDNYQGKVIEQNI